MVYLFKRHLECHSISVLQIEQYHIYYFSLKGNADAIFVDLMFYSVSPLLDQMNATFILIRAFLNCLSVEYEILSISILIKK